MTAAEYDRFAVRAARLAAKNTGDLAAFWWAQVERYEALAEKARVTEETR